MFDKDGVSNFTGDVRTVFEMVNLKRAWEWLRRSMAERHTLTVDLILEAHRVLTQGTYDERRWERGERPGRFKVHDHRVVDDVGLPPEEVPEAMCELATEVADALGGGCADRRLLVIAAYLHAKLVSIHPFADGNGRCARLLMNRTLMMAGLPPLTIAETDRLAYFGALDAFCRDGELAPFTEFCQIQSLRTWEGLMSSACFMHKSVERGGLPFDVRPEPKIGLDLTTIIQADATPGKSVLPACVDGLEDAGL